MGRRAIGIAVLGAVAVIAASSWFFLRERPIDLSAQGTTPEVADRLSATAAQAQRNLHYEGIDSIDAIRGLPSRFARMEALYVVAGRADLGALRGLIRDAQSIPN